MDLLTALRTSASRLAAATPRDATAAACHAADTGETAALALLHLAATGDAPAYLVAADAFALARAHLAGGVASAPRRIGRADRNADGTDPLALEAATAQLASTLLAALATLSTQLREPARVLAVARAGLAAADAHRVMTPGTGDDRHLR